MWWGICSLLHVVIVSILSPTINYPETLTESITGYIVLGTCCYFTSTSMRYYLPRREKYWYILVLSLCISGISLFLTTIIVKLFFSADVHFIEMVEKSSGGRFGISFLLVACVLLVSLLIQTQNEQSDFETRKNEAEELTREAELFRLRQQLQPHFLFNSLNSISALTGSQPEKARHMIQQLSDFLRGTLRNESKQWSTLQEEMEHLQLYLDIEKVRFGYRLQTNVICEDDVLQKKIPSLLLQPIVENAIKFGLYDTTGEVLITIQTKAINDLLEVIVDNPYDPETAYPQQGTGFGLSSIQRRLFLLFARHDLLQTQSINNHFITTVKIPQTA
jgi:sensor histidine kinase YesM